MLVDEMRALVLAGGFATRLGPIGQALPKPLLVAEGDTILGHLIKKLEKEGIEAVISTNQKFEPFFRGYKNVIIEKTMREEEKLGAVSAIDYAIKKVGIDDDLVVVCADNFFSSDFRGFVSSFTGELLFGVYYVGERPDMKPEEMATLKFRGSDRYPPPSDTFYIEDFKEKVKPPLSNYVSTGIYIFPKRVFPILEEFCKTAKRDAPGFFIQHLLERGEKIKGYLFKGEWYDVSHKSYLQAFTDGRLLKSDECLVAVDKPLGERLVSSITLLHAGKSTDEYKRPTAGIYFFIEGEGEMEWGGKRSRVSSKDVIFVKPNEPHRIYNTSDVDLIFVTVFEK
jgi:glucose-1-phosphate thymidylyltransferase